MSYKDLFVPGKTKTIALPGNSHVETKIVADYNVFRAGTTYLYFVISQTGKIKTGKFKIKLNTFLRAT